MSAALRHVSLALCLFALSTAGCRKKPTEAHFRLDNGLRVDLFATSRGDSAALTLLFDIGSDHDPPGRSGMARLVEHLFATGGRPGKPARALDQPDVPQAPDAHAWDAETGADYTIYAVVAPSGRLMDEVDDAALRMSGLMLTDADLDRERSRLLAEIAAAQEHDAMSAAMTRAAEAVRPSRGGGLRGGVASEIEAMTLDEVDAYRRAHYGGATARLVLAGHFDVAEATTRIQTAFAKAPAGKPPQPRPPSGARVTGTLVMGDAPSAVALAVPVPEPKDPLYPAFLVLAARVTDAGGTSRAWKGDFAPLARPDILFVTSTLPAGEPPEAFAARMRAEVNAVVGAPLAADEPARAVEKFGALLGMTPLRAETCAAEPHQTAFAAGRRAQLGIDGGALALAAGAITPEQLVAAARLFDAKSSAAVIAGGHR